MGELEQAEVWASEMLDKYPENYVMYAEMQLLANTWQQVSDGGWLE